ncbi:unnamed protein product [Parascedosporium putredinis]|uniref:PRISE-like Rossmann-fold domain-containing protein n=1 Tax=Parascedosporium putredinis TaxID=1442378 RepID=A0A9P1H820_9PEZI|nr:unnamed protein product [Parascedosporium putredinis]CAI8000378.1 unnamed protein product [Parascedosporium putredinis]
MSRNGATKGDDMITLGLIYISRFRSGALSIIFRDTLMRYPRTPNRPPPQRQPQTVETRPRRLAQQKEDFRGSVQHASIDLLGSSDDIADGLRGVEAEYLFFAAYMERESEQESWDVNGDMLQNFLDALEKVGVARSLKRVVLVTGAKQYGVHLGAPKNPMDESDPWLTDDRFPPNFYYRQQDILKKFGEKNGVPWTVTYPNDELGQDLVFPGSEEFYTKFDCFTSADLHAEFVDWAIDQDQTGNQAFNVVNGDIQSWQSLWPLLARRFGVKVKEDQFDGPAELRSESTLWDTPPLSVFEKEAGLKGRVRPGKLQQNIDIVKWSEREDVRQAWARLAERHGLQQDALEKATWSFLALVLGRNFDLVINTTKARKAGWTG